METSPTLKKLHQQTTTDSIINEKKLCGLIQTSETRLSFPLNARQGVIG